LLNYAHLLPSDLAFVWSSPLETATQELTGMCLRRRVVLFSVSIALSFLNYRGLHIIGNAAVASTVYIIIPFVVLAVLALPHVEPRHWVHEDWSAVQWSEFINVMFW
jgi:amino acid transporter